MAYISSAFLSTLRPSIAGCCDDWGALIREAESVLLEDIARYWYARCAKSKGVATAFDPAKLLRAQTELKWPAGYLSLAMTYDAIAKDDNDRRDRETYQQAYRRALWRRLASGLTYDWDGTGTATTPSCPVTRSLLGSATLVRDGCIDSCGC